MRRLIASEDRLCRVCGLRIPRGAPYLRAGESPVHSICGGLILSCGLAGKPASVAKDEIYARSLDVLFDAAAAMAILDELLELARGEVPPLPVLLPPSGRTRTAVGHITWWRYKAICRFEGTELVTVRVNSNDNLNRTPAYAAEWGLSGTTPGARMLAAHCWQTFRGSNREHQADCAEEGQDQQ